jgi:glucose-6-phosphate dehydrogenase assembly protein OpcA
MIVYAEHEEGTAQASRAIAELAEHHPSRVLILAARPSDDDSHLEADLSAHCHVGTPSDQKVCCEEVTLRVSGRAARHLHSVAIPLLVPDLPVYVWWTEPLPADEHALHGLLDTADRLIVDSSHFENAPAGLSRLAALAGREPSAGFGDLNWRRFGPLRELLRGEGRVEEVRHHLRSVESVEIRYAGDGPARAGQALLFLSWLAQELEWAPASALGHGRNRIEFRGDERRVAAFLEPVDYPAIDPGGLVSVKISCRSAQTRAFITVSRTGDPSHVTIHTEHEGHAAENSVRVTPPQLHELLMDELDAAAHDPEYRRVLEGVPALERAMRGW